MKSIRYVALVIVFLFVTVIPVSAQIDDLYVMALEYYNETCFEKNIKKEKAILCYLFEKTEDLNNRVVVLENQASSSVKQIYVYDYDGNELGIYMGGYTFFYEPLEKMVRVPIGIPDNTPIYFEDSECSDTPYYIGGEILEDITVNGLFLGSKDLATNQEYYYTIDQDIYVIGLDSYSFIDTEWPTYELVCTDEHNLIDATNPHNGRPQRAYEMQLIPPELLPEYIVHPAVPLIYKTK